MLDAQPHMAGMGDPRASSLEPPPDDPPGWRVVDDLPRDYPVSRAELEAVEAFLMPLIARLLADATEAEGDERQNSDGGPDSQAPRTGCVRNDALESCR